MSLHDAVALSRLVLVSDPRATLAPEGAAPRRFRLARVKPEAPAPAPPASFEHLARCYD